MDRSARPGQNPDASPPRRLAGLASIREPLAQRATTAQHQRQAGHGRARHRHAHPLATVRTGRRDQAGANAAVVARTAVVAGRGRGALAAAAGAVGDEVVFVIVLVSFVFSLVAGGFTTVVLFSVFFSAGEAAGVFTVSVFCSHAAKSAALAKMQNNFFIVVDWLSLLGQSMNRHKLRLRPC